MAKNPKLNLSIQIAGKIDKSLANAIGQAKRSVGGFSKTLSKVGTAGLSAMTGMTAGAVAGIIDATKEAKDFEKQMADVVKYVDGLADSTGKISNKIDTTTGRSFAQNYDMMKDAIIELSTQIPMTAEELTQMAAAAGQSGKAMDDLIQRDKNGDIQGFLKDVAMMGTAMDIDADKAGNWAAKWEKAFNMNHDDIMELSDQINYLGANSATTAAEIGEVVNRAGSVGQLAGASVSTTAALADAMLATGVQANRAGTGLKNFFTRISLGESATKAQQEAWTKLGFTSVDIAKSMQKDNIGTIKNVFNAINQLPDHERLATIKDLFGMWTTEGAAKIANNMSTFTDALDMVSNPELYKGSMEREFLIKANTTEAVDKMLSNAWKGFKIDFGTEFLPVRKQFAQTMVDVMGQVRERMPALKKLGETLADVLAKGVSKLGDALDKGIPKLQKGLDYINNNGSKVAKIIGGMAAAFGGMKAAPAISSVLGGAGHMIFGEKSGFGNNKKRKGGLFGLGKNSNSNMQMIFNGAKLGMNLAGSKSMTAGGMVGGKGGFFSSLINKGVGAFFGAKNAKGLFDEKAKDNTVFRNLLTVAQNIHNTQKRGLAGEAKLAVRGAKNRIGGLVGKITNSAPVNAIKGIGSGITGIGGVSGGGLLGALKSVLGGGGGLLKSGAGALGGILSGGLPIVGALSGAIGLFGVMYDNLDGIREMIGSIFGEQGIAVFDTFKGGLDGVISSIGNILDNGIGDILEPVKEKVVEFFESMFGKEAADMVSDTFDSIVGIIDTCLGVLGQVVQFANDYVKPIIETIFNFIATKVVPFITRVFNTVAPLIQRVIKTIGTVVTNVAKVIAKAIEFIWPLIEGIANVIMNIADVVLPILVDVFTVAWDTIGGIIETVSSVFGGIITFLTDVFTGNWEDAWNAIKDFFKSIWDSIGDIVVDAINFVIDCINGMISGIVEGINAAKNFLIDFGITSSGAGGAFDEATVKAMKDSLNIDAPQIPHLAGGGFTQGLSIAGEKGTEAVISFDPSVRNQNVDTWMRAGKLLGLNSPKAEVKPINMPQAETKVVFAPNITIQGNADEGTVDYMVNEMHNMFDEWYNKKMRTQMRTAY